MRRFEDKNAIVTGAASGIGQATAVRLTREGARVACVDRNEDGLAQTAARIAEAGGEPLLFACDVSDFDNVHETVNAAVAALGSLEVLANVAGILRADHTHELAYEDWDRVIKVNLYGTFAMCRAALPHLLAKKGSSIVNTSSTAAIGSHPWMAAYAASKGGVISFTRVLAVEYVRRGLRANCICPGAIKTPLHGQFSMPPGANPRLLQGAVPMIDYAEPDTVAATIAFLASDDASFITGVDVRVDGGALG
jgi:NAD(P)-dependent dehydrogenase (short-subunit alcohol dehydrogenase family)